MKTHFIASTGHQFLRLPPRCKHLLITAWRMALIVNLTVFLLGQEGCRHVPPTAVPAEIRAHPGVVALIAPKAPPDIDAGPRVTGKAGGAAQGAGKATAGMWKGCLTGGGKDTGWFVIFCALATPFVAVGGAVVGAVSHEWKDVTAAQAQARVETALEELKFQATLRDRVLAVARSRTPHTFVVRPEYDPLTLSDRPDFRLLAQANVDTVLEVSLTDIGMKQLHDSKSFYFVMKARASLNNARSGEALYADTFVFESGVREFPQWAENDAAALGQALDQGYQYLAESIVRYVFLQ